MPKLNECFHKPRITAYNVAIDALYKVYENRDLDYPGHTETLFVLKKLERERNQFAKKFGVERK